MKMRHLNCHQCSARISKPLSEIRKGHKRHFCSLKCRNDAFRTGRTYAEDKCAGCGAHVRQLKTKAERNKRHYCSRECFRKHADYSALGKLTAGVPRPANSLAHGKLPKSSPWYAISPRFTQVKP